MSLLRAAAADDRRPPTAYVPGLDAGLYRARALAALDDDLDTPRAIGALRDLGEAILAAAARGQPADEARAELRTLAGVLGARL